MSIFVETTTLQDDTLKKEQTLLSTLSISHSLAGQMNQARGQFWSLPDDQLLAVLNADTQTALDTQPLLDTLAGAINALLDAAVEDRPELAANFPSRAALGYGRADVEYDDTIPAFKINPPPP